MGKNLLFIFFIYSFKMFAQTGGIEGFITSEDEPVVGANIYIVETDYATYSADDGFYSIKSIPAGEYKLRISSIGYETKFVIIKVSPARISKLNIELKSKAIQVDEIEVIGSKIRQQSDTRASLIELKPKSAKNLPGSAEDVMRTLQSLPGVTSPNDFSTQLIVRGSGPDQNLIIMDDVEVFNPYRLYGVISMFNPEVVSEINLITGGFPAKYGDRLSAVLDVTNRAGNSEKFFSGSINANITDANIVLEGKNPFGLDGSWIFHSRRTYYDLIIEPFVKKTGLVKDNVTFPNFYDIQGKVVLSPFKNHKFILNGIYSRDGVNVISGENRQTVDSIGVTNVTRNDLASIAWHYFPTKKFFNKVTLSWYENGGNTDLEAQVIDPSLNREAFDGVLLDTVAIYLLGFGVKSDFSFKKYSFDEKFLFNWGNNELEAGFGADFMRTVIDFNFKLDPQLQAILNSNPNIRSAIKDLKDIKDYYRYKFFVQNRFSFHNKIYVQPSLRVDYYKILRKTYLSPRISISYPIDDITTLRTIWGIYYQSPGYEKIRDQNILFDLSPKYAEALNAEKATHYVLSLERWLTSEWNAKLEGYYKKLDDLIIQKKVLGTKYYTESILGKDIRYADGWTQPVVVSSDSLTQIPINGSDGSAYGLEFILEKRNISASSPLSGWISYSYSFANRNEDGKTIPFRFDRRHTLNLVLNYKLNSWLELGVRWQYATGFPFTKPIGIKPRIVLKDVNGDRILEPIIATRKSYSDPSAKPMVIFDIDYGENPILYNDRKPDYHRLDVRLTAYTNFWGLDWSFYLDVINVFNRKNIINYDYYINSDLTIGQRANTMFPIIPTFGLSARF